MKDETQNKQTADGVDKNVTPDKKFFMSKEEIAFLQQRFIIIQQNNLINSDLKGIMDLFVRNQVLGRIGVVGEEKNKWDVDYNIIEGTFVLKPASQQVQQSPSGIIVPSMVPPEDIEKSKN